MRTTIGLHVTGSPRPTIADGVIILPLVKAGFLC